MALQSLSGLVALVTGAAGNIGLAIVDTLTMAGATVIATDIRADGGQNILAHDVTSESSWREIIDRIAGGEARLDILVNNAGIAPIARIEAISISEWRRCQAINVEGAMLGMNATLAQLKASGAGRPGGGWVVNIASVAANKAAPMTAAYCCSKAALVMLTKVAALEFASLGYQVRVNTVNPGAVESAMIDGIIRRYADIVEGESVETLEQSIRQDVPMGRLARPDDVADAVRWLASSESRFVTGSELHVDGGLTAR